MRTILSGGIALSALAVVTPAWGQAGIMPGDDRTIDDEDGERAPLPLPVPHLGTGPAWDLADEAGSHGFSRFASVDQAQTTGAHRQGVASGSFRLVAGTIGEAHGVVRFSYHGGYVRGRPRFDFGGTGCGSSLVDGSTADSFARCGSAPIPVERTARIHQGGLERSWQGMVEGVWSLGGDNAVTMGGGISKARRFQEEARSQLPDGLHGIGFALGADMLGAIRQQEKVATVFASTRLAVGGLVLTPGLRYERTRQRIRGFLPDADLAMQRRRTFGVMLPSMTVTASPSPRTTLRLRWSRDAGRADLLAQAPGGTIERNSGQVWLGNPRLRPSRADTVDLTGSWALEDNGTLGVTLFSRHADDPIVGSSENREGGVIAGRYYDRLMLTQAVNAQSGRETGIEARYRRQLDFLPGALADLGLEVVAGYARANVTLEPGAARMSFRPRTLYGATLSWRRGSVESMVSWMAADTALLALGDRYAGAQAQQRLDARTGIAVSRNLRLFLEGQNLTDAPTLQFRDGLRNWSIENERYGRTVLAGMSARF